MPSNITISLPKEIESALEQATREEGLPQNELIKKAISNYLFIRKFRLLRERLTRKANRSYTDQDIFEIVS